jgi:hypothetical protein
MASATAAAQPQRKPTSVAANRTAKRRRRIVSLIGALIVFGTFLAKDVRRDKLKDLVDSIESAENSYLIRAGNRRTLQEIKGFEKSFSDFRRNPTAPEDQLTEADFEDRGVGFYLQTTHDDQLANMEIYDELARLAEKLPGAQPEKNSLQAAKQLDAEFWEEWNAVDKEAMKLPDAWRVKDTPLAKQLEAKIFTASAAGQKCSQTLESVSREILHEAANERVKAEANYEMWNKFTFLLYGVGFVIGIFGILMGGEDDSIVESLQGEG